MDNLFQEIAFWFLAAVTVGGALAVVRTQNMFRAALMLVVSFAGVAGIFALINAEFLAVVQVLIYGGGVAVLVIFAVMVTNDVAEGNRNTRTQPFALIAGAALFATLAMAGMVWTVDLWAAALPQPLRLAALVATGAITYGAWLVLFARDTVRAVIHLALDRQVPEPV